MASRRSPPPEDSPNTTLDNTPHPEVLTSDEAIVAVFRHEMFELSLMREVFGESADGSMDGADYGIQTSVGRPGNFHDLAWDEADEIVLRMRGQGR